MVDSGHNKKQNMVERQINQLINYIAHFQAQSIVAILISLINKLKTVKHTYYLMLS